jgi:hypothetical protein
MILCRSDGIIYTTSERHSWPCEFLGYFRLCHLPDFSWAASFCYCMFLVWSSCWCVVYCTVVALVVHVAPDGICLSAHNLKFNYRAREISPFVPLLCQRKLVHLITIIFDRKISTATCHLRVSLPESRKGDDMKNIKNSRSWYIYILSQ